MVGHEDHPLGQIESRHVSVRVGFNEICELGRAGREFERCRPKEDRDEDYFR